MQGLAFAEELGGEQDRQGGVLSLHPAGEADGDGGLDDHHGGGGAAFDLGDHILDGGGVEVVGLRVVVRGGRDDHEIRTRERLACVGGGPQLQGPARQVLLDLGVHDGGAATVDQVNPALVEIDCDHLVPLGQQDSHGQAYVAEPNDRDSHGTSFCRRPRDSGCRGWHQKSSTSPNVRVQSLGAGGDDARGRVVNSGPCFGSGTRPACGPVRRPMA